MLFVHMSELGPSGNKLRYTLSLPPIDSLTNEWVFPDVGRLTLTPILTQVPEYQVGNY